MLNLGTSDPERLLRRQVPFAARACATLRSVASGPEGPARQSPCVPSFHSAPARRGEVRQGEAKREVPCRRYSAGPVWIRGGTRRSSVKACLH
jgi:hypothetical protein